MGIHGMSQYGFFPVLDNAWTGKINKLKCRTGNKLNFTLYPDECHLGPMWVKWCKRSQFRPNDTYLITIWYIDGHCLAQVRPRWIPYVLISVQNSYLAMSDL